MSPSSTAPPLLEMREITKEFPGVKALKGVTFTGMTGEVLGLCGENGAGKSTLMKVLSGVHPYPTYGGDIYIDGTLKRFSNTRAAEAAGVAIIHQELNLVPQMTVAENIFLGREPTRFGFVITSESRREARRALTSLGIDIDPDIPVGELGIGKQQMVEIAKALSLSARILVLDEPTSALTELETEHLFRVIRDLKSRGVMGIYISHKLDEVFEICDRIAVLRDGEIVGKPLDTDTTTTDEIIFKMVGRKLTELYPPRANQPGEVVMEINNFSVNHPFLPGENIVQNISFTVRAGEILGIAGLMGSGRSELVTAVFGAFPDDSQGTMILNGRDTVVDSPEKALSMGIGLVTEDRKGFGLIPEMSVGENITLACLRELCRFGFVHTEREKHCVRESIETLKIKTPGPETMVSTLSGGNQQKVVISRMLNRQPTILIMDEPTRGVDVGARREIYTIMNELTSKGVAIIMVSSDLPEILGMSDRVLIMREGTLAGELPREKANQETIMAFATGTAAT